MKIFNHHSYAASWCCVYIIILYWLQMKFTTAKKNFTRISRWKVNTCLHNTYNNYYYCQTLFGCAAYYVYILYNISYDTGELWFPIVRDSPDPRIRIHTFYDVQVATMLYYFTLTLFGYNTIPERNSQHIYHQSMYMYVYIITRYKSIHSSILCVQK